VHSAECCVVLLNIRYTDFDLLTFQIVISFTFHAEVCGVSGFNFVL